jgi:hypothetical protein
MDSSYFQAIIWILAIVLLVLYMNRRRRRRMHP